MAESCTFGSILGLRPTQYDVCYFGDILSFTTLGEAVYPSDDITRVTSLVHSWQPGEYLLQVGLGEVVSEFVLQDIGLPYTRGVDPGPDDDTPPRLIRGPCHPGEGRCFGNHWYICKEFPPTTFELPGEAHWVWTKSGDSFCRGGYGPER